LPSGANPGRSGRPLPSQHPDPECSGDRCWPSPAGALSPLGRTAGGPRGYQQNQSRRLQELSTAVPNSQFSVLRYPQPTNVKPPVGKNRQLKTHRPLLQLFRLKRNVALPGRLLFPIMANPRFPASPGSHVTTGEGQGRNFGVQDRNLLSSALGQ